MSAMGDCVQQASSIKWVIFDIGGVLTPPLPELYAGSEIRAGVPPGTMLSMFGNKRIREAYYSMEAGKTTVYDFEKEFNDEWWNLHNVTDRSKPFTLAFKDNLHLEPVLPVMLKAMDDIQKRGFKIALLTNNFFVSKDRSLTYFPTKISRDKADLVVESCVEKIRKPDAGIFHLTLKRMDVDPGEVIFVDDVDANVEAANALGIRSIKFESPTQCLEELEKLLHIPLQGTS